MWLVLHANHAREFTPDAHARRSAASRPQAIPVLGQSVLLRGVNDSAAALEALFRAMLAARVKPYYLHQLDAAPGTARFHVPIEEGRRLLARTARPRHRPGVADLRAGYPGRPRQGADRPGLSGTRRPRARSRRDAAPDICWVTASRVCPRRRQNPRLPSWRPVGTSRTRSAVSCFSSPARGSGSSAVAAMRVWQHLSTAAPLTATLAPACPTRRPGLEAGTPKATDTGSFTMKQQANLIRAGQVIEHEGRRWTVLKQQIITPGKGGAFIQVEMRDLKSGNKTNERWRTADTRRAADDRGEGIQLLLHRRHQHGADGPGHLRGGHMSRWTCWATWRRSCKTTCA